MLNGNHCQDKLGRVYTTIIVQETLYPDVSSYSCPSDYTVYLPDADNYGIGYTIAIMPERLCDPEAEQCTINPRWRYSYIMWISTISSSFNITLKGPVDVQFIWTFFIFIKYFISQEGEIKHD